MSKKKIMIKLVERRGETPCHHGHKIGDEFDFDTARGQLCPMAMHVAFPYIDILRYGGTPPCSKKDGRMLFCCPDCDVMNIFEITVR
ncbi:MAG: TIGR04076 family protein [Victivallaceae bacterium]|nr:TIGR04076 family protein [Victivallaceae bacterium]